MTTLINMHRYGLALAAITPGSFAACQEYPETAFLNLKDSTVGEILSYLGCPPGPATLRYLNRLIHAYIRRVPWESVSRIVKRQLTWAASDCPRWPEEFWRDAMDHGFGGTCFESSLAFYALLTGLGYRGYLTVNDMGDTQGCHAAIVILLDGEKYLVDVTISLHCAVRIVPNRITRRRTSFQTYTLRPMGQNIYNVERSRHPHRYAFTLKDVPVSPSDYRTILVSDYAPTGHFLNRVVITKVIADKLWRFFSDIKPYRLECFYRGNKSETFLPLEAMPQALAEKFSLPEDKIRNALLVIQDQAAVLEGEGIV